MKHMWQENDSRALSLTFKNDAVIKHQADNYKAEND